MANNIRVNANTCLEDAFLTDERYAVELKVSSKKNIYFNPNMALTFKGASALNYNFLNSRFNFDLVTNMASTFQDCYKLNIEPFCPPNVSNFTSTYRECRSIYGDAICGPNITNMYYTYFNCESLNGTGYVEKSVAGNNRYLNTFWKCNNLTGLYLNAANLADFFTQAFQNNIVSNLSNINIITFGDGAIGNTHQALRYCNTLTNLEINVSDFVTHLGITFCDCYNMIAEPKTGNNVTNMFATYQNCYNLIGEPVCGPLVTSFTQCYRDCRNITGDAVCGQNVPNMYYTYFNCGNLNGTAYVEKSVTGANRYLNAFWRCNNLTGLYLNAIDMSDFFASAFQNNVASNLSNIRKIRIGDQTQIAPSAMRYVTTLGNVELSVGNNIYNMRVTFADCYNMVAEPVSGPNVKDMYATYYLDYNLIGNPACGPLVTNLVQTYQECHNITGDGVCGPSVTNMYYAYKNCGNLNGTAYVGQSVTGTNRYYQAFWKCNNLTGIYLNAADTTDFFVSAFQNNATVNLSNVRKITIGDGCKTTTYQAMRYCNTLTNVEIEISDNIPHLGLTFGDCYNMVAEPKTGNNVTNMYATYYLDYNLIGQPVCGPLVKDFRQTYQDCRNVSGDGVCGPSVTNMYYAYFNCGNLNGTAQVEKSVTGANRYLNAFWKCNNLTGFYLNAVDMTDFFVSAFQNNVISNLSNVTHITLGPGITTTASQVFRYASTLNVVNLTIDDNVKNLYYAFQSCYNMIAEPKTSAATVSQRGTYEWCYNLVGQPVCGPNVTDFVVGYNDCRNITGDAVCGPKVTNMYWTYQNCGNLNGTAFTGPSLTTAANKWVNAFLKCNKLTGFYLDSPDMTSFFAQAVTTATNLSNINKIEFGPNVKTTHLAFSGAATLQSPQIVFDDNIPSLSQIFDSCTNLNSIPAYGLGATSMYATYIRCYNMNQQPVCGPNVTDFRHCYTECRNIYGDGVCGPKVTNMYYTYFNCGNLNGIGYIGNTVGPGENFNNTFYLCNNISGFYLNGANMNQFHEIAIRTATSLANVKSVEFGPGCTQAYIAFRYAGTLAANSVKFADSVIYDRGIFQQCYNLNIEPVHPNYTTDIGYGYYDCRTVYGNAPCPQTATRMDYAYFNCGKLNGTAYVEKGITGANRYLNAFWKCNNLTGLYLNATDMTDFFASAFQNNAASNLSNIRNITLGDGVSIAHQTMRDASLVGPVNLNISDNVTNLRLTFAYCYNMIAEPKTGNNVIDMHATYHVGYNLIGQPVCGPNTTNFVQTYLRCYNLTGNAVCGPKVTNMQRTYENCYNLNGTAFTGPSLTTAANKWQNAFLGCHNLTGFYLDSPSMADFYKSAVTQSTNLSNVKRIEFGPNATNIWNVFDYCNTFINPQIIIPDTVTQMTGAFRNCRIMTTQPVCGNGVTDFTSAYEYGYKLGGNPVCGPKVEIMRWTYIGCNNLTGSVELSQFIKNMYYAFYQTEKIQTVVLPNTTYLMANANFNNTFRRTVFTTRMNVVVGNLATYNNMRVGTLLAGCTFTASELTPDVDKFIVNNKEFVPVRYCYNAAQNIYLYCLT